MNDTTLASTTSHADTVDQPSAELTRAPSEGADIFFPVALRPAQVDGTESPDFVAVKRLDTGRIFAFRSRDYRLILNSEIFPMFDEAVNESFDVTGLRVVDELAMGGARVVRRYQFPAHRKEVNLGDLVELELKVVNSYDGSM